MDFSQTAIEELDVAAFKNLETLSLKKTPMTELDVSACESLVNLDCSDSKLLSLFASGLPKLKVVNINGIVGMSTLNLTDNTSMTELYCNNSEISSLYLEGCGALIKMNAENTPFISLSLSNCPLIEEVILDGSIFSSIDLSNNTKLKNFVCRNNTTIADIDLSYCSPSMVDLSGCTSLSTIYLSPSDFSKVNKDGEIAGWKKPAGAVYSEF